MQISLRPQSVYNSLIKITSSRVQPGDREFCSGNSLLSMRELVVTEDLNFRLEINGWSRIRGTLRAFWYWLGFASYSYCDPSGDILPNCTSPRCRKIPWGHAYCTLIGSGTKSFRKVTGKLHIRQYDFCTRGSRNLANSLQLSTPKRYMRMHEFHMDNCPPLCIFGRENHIFLNYSYYHYVYTRTSGDRDKDLLSERETRLAVCTKSIKFYNKITPFYFYEKYFAHLIYVMMQGCTSTGASWPSRNNSNQTFNVDSRIMHLLHILRFPQNGMFETCYPLARCQRKHHLGRNCNGN